MSATVPTRLLCSEHWEGDLRCEIVPLSQGERVYMEFTVQGHGRLEGMFEVVNRLHMYKDDKGYFQKVELEAAE